MTNVIIYTEMNFLKENLYEISFLNFFNEMQAVVKCTIVFKAGVEVPVHSIALGTEIKMIC